MYKRSNELELMDLGPSYYTQEEYDDCLYQLSRVGRYLGGNQATLKTFKKILAPKSILEVGCGGGEFTLQLAKQFPKAIIIGIDISPQAIEYAQKRLDETNLNNVQFVVPPNVELNYPNNSFDVVTTTLVCHHMNDEQLVEFLKKAYLIASKHIIINDLHRSWLAYFSFGLIAGALFRNRLIYHDGLLSIKRSFQKKDWFEYLTAAGIPLEKCKITWHWAFRWIIRIDTSK